MADEDPELRELNYLRDRALRSIPHGKRHQVSSRDKPTTPSDRRQGNHYARSRDRGRDFTHASSSSPSSHSYSTSTSSLRSRSTMSSRSRTPSCSPSRSYSSSISSSYSSRTTPDSLSYTPPSNRYHQRSLTPPHRLSRAPRHRRLSESPSYTYTSLPRRDREKPPHTVPRRGPRSPRDDRNRRPLPPPLRDSHLHYSDRPTDRHRYSDEYRSRLPSPPLPPSRSRPNRQRSHSPDLYRTSLPPPPSSRRSTHPDRDYRGDPPPGVRLRRDRHLPDDFSARSRIRRSRELHDSRDHTYRSSRHDLPPPLPPPTRHERRPPSPLPPRHPKDRLRPPPRSPRASGRLRPRSPRDVGRLRPRSPREIGRLRPRSPRESGRLRPRSPRESGRLLPRPRSPRERGRLHPRSHSPRESGRLLYRRSHSPHDSGRLLRSSRERGRIERTERVVRKVVRHDDESLSPDIHHHFPSRERSSEHDHSNERVLRSGDDRKKAEHRHRPQVRESSKRRPVDVSHEGTERRKRQIVSDSAKSDDERSRPSKQTRRESIDSVSPDLEDEGVVTDLEDAQREEAEDEVVNVSLTNAMEATLDEELDYDETMENADLHLIEVEDNVEGSPVANDGSVGADGDNEVDPEDLALLQETDEVKIKDETDSVEVEEGEMKDELEEGEEIEEGEAVDDEEEEIEEGLLRSEGSHTDEDNTDIHPEKDFDISSSSDELPEPLPSSKPGIVISSPIRVSPERERRHRSSYHSSDEPRQDRDPLPPVKLPVKERLFLSKKDLEHKKRASNYKQEHRLSSNLARRLGPSPFRRRDDSLSSSQRSSWRSSQKSPKRDAVAIAEAYRRQKRKEQLMERDEEVRKGRRMAKLLNKVHEQPSRKDRRDRRRAAGSEEKNGMRHGRENDLDKRISKIREKNKAILKRKHEVDKDKRMYS